MVGLLGEEVSISTRHCRENGLFQEGGADTLLCRDAGRKLQQFQLGGAFSGINAGQLNQAAVQQLAQAGVLSAATNGAVVSQGNTNLG